jgi:hypothetical protein
MITPVMSTNPSEPSLDPIRQELLELLTQTEAGYAWNPADPAWEDCFEAASNSFTLTDDLDATALEANADRFFAIANQAWRASSLNTIKANLWEQFARYIPNSRLDQIFEQAQSLAAQNLSTLNQLVACVKPLWSEWNEDDLSIIARPLAVVMRGKIALKPASWNELTEIEQIRLTMMAAQEALTQITRKLE